MWNILFKGKSVDTGEWVEGYLVCDREFWNKEDFRAYIVGHKHPSSCFGRDIYIEVDPNTVGQFTGLTDVDGVKIFEGDIIRNVTPGTERKFEGPIQYSGLFCNFSVNGVINLYGVVEQYRVIGNTHDNTEV